MAHVVPLALQFVRPDLTAEVPSPPHDSLSTDARRRYVQSHPLSFLNVTRAPDDEDNGTGDVLAAGRQSLEHLLAEGVFGPSTGPAFFVYRLEQGSHCQTGLVAGVATADYENATVKVHEQVRRERVGHLARHLRVVGAQSSPIALAYAGHPLVTEAIARTAERSSPFLDFSDDRGLRQQIWQVTDSADIAAMDGAFDDASLYLIDGHHRAAAASADHQDFGSQNGGTHFMLAALFPHEELRSFAFHRFLSAVDPVAIEAEITAHLPVRKTTDLNTVATRGEAEIALALPTDGGDDPTQWLLIDVPLDPTDTVGLSNIDPVRLSERVLEPLLGIEEASSDKRLTYVPGTGDIDELATIQPDRGEAVFVMRAIATSTLLAVSDAQLVMPPKSTYFQPKVRSGLFVRLVS